ncbi:MAG: hypothetical protein [Microviridae sp.]|nr:MAG: hypothetical protein [Microviridae sp.]
MPESEKPEGEKGGTGAVRAGLDGLALHLRRRLDRWRVASHRSSERSRGARSAEKPTASRSGIRNRAAGLRGWGRQIECYAGKRAQIPRCPAEMQRCPKGATSQDEKKGQRPDRAAIAATAREGCGKQERQYAFQGRE